MFISALELFKIGIGPSSSHTMGPMSAAIEFISLIQNNLQSYPDKLSIRCTLKGSLSFTGKGHATDKAIILGLHGYTPQKVAGMDIQQLTEQLSQETKITLANGNSISFNPEIDIIFDKGPALQQHPNGIIFELLNEITAPVISETYFSIGGGFIYTANELEQIVAPIKMEATKDCPYGFDSAESMLSMSQNSQLTVAQMKHRNECMYLTETELDQGLDATWQAMEKCVENGLNAEGILPGGLDISRRARGLYLKLKNQPQSTNMNDYLCAYAMAVNEENAAGHMVVTAPTNGAAGVIPATLNYFVKHEHGTPEQIREFLLTASAIGGLIKHKSSISGAEVGCQGEVGSASAMAAAGLCAVKGGNTQQIENAAEIALEHHLGMTCDPVNGLVQVPCIERNGFGAIKAYTAASLALHGTGEHFMPLDNCIAAMRQTGLEMSDKFKETSLGGLAVSITEC